ncbi:hypothetical protein GGS23DRAFT_237135 [Durotheca rogersii]|uniref:uncharacterized protein n=1 Tax=Durotheca rogersii TaxID=419775 RepID=UPI00221FE6A1|nr:uncharacterized protein GGS23DRAFT_237135 [Durotheca rogersii]KAI5860440.1 hypothetical protein GGS23DRAFT_237135 [Durotheca rogersii]
MSYPPAKRQRSNTSRDSVNGTPQTAAPALRHAQLSQGLGLYTSPTAYDNGGYGLQPAPRQPITYHTYSPSSVANSAGAFSGAYQTSAGYGAGPYSPQQAVAFAAQYAQTPANGQMGSHAAHFAQPGVDEMRNGGFADAQVQVQTQAQVQAQAQAQALVQGQASQAGSGATYSPIPTTHHISSYSQPPRPNDVSTTTTLPHHPPHALSQYGDSYGSQPTAHATYHATSTPYPDAATLNSHFSPAPIPAPTAQNGNGNQHTPEDVMHENGDEDAQGETTDESTEMVYSHAELSLRDSLPPPSVDSPPKAGHENKCCCKKGRGKKKACVSCVCSKYGLGCTAACSCGAACANPFADLSLFFGPPSVFSKPCGANSCFATWLCNQPNIEELDMDLMVDMLLYDDTSWASIREFADPFKKWEESWKKARGGKSKKQRDERERLEFELLRGGLGNSNQNDFYGYWYSFCRGGWVPIDHWDHCQECRVCKPSIEWHCDKHGRCTTDRICPDCTAVPYADMMATYPESGG